MKKIAILGGGVLGSAISNIVSFNGHDVVMYSNDLDSVEEINKKHTNTKYTDCPINNNVIASNNLTETLKNVDYIFIILPSKAVVGVLRELKEVNIEFTRKFVIFSKGIDGDSGKFFSDLISDFFPKSDIAVLSGPNFAEEIIKKQPTITTVATKNIIYYNELENILNCHYFKIKYFDDLKAVQLSGLVKNVLAILCGIADGLELGRNTFAAIILTGIEEIKNLCLRYSCSDDVIDTPAGIGDIVLTCGSKKSRNMSFGFRIGSGEKMTDILNSLDYVVEGLSNAKNLSKLSNGFGIDSIADVLIDIVQNNYSKQELTDIIIKKIFK
jgi:glycerol-3-phosphate dehydrogenase (NAD(P)+)